MAGAIVTLLLHITALLGVVRGGVDLTVRENATGHAVVDAVVDLITQSCLFDNDRLMLRRIAYAETRDGASNRTFTRGGGIWQVDKTSFLSTQSNLSVLMKDSIKRAFGVDWSQARYGDLRKPLYSGIAAMLKIIAYHNSRSWGIPQSIVNQANYWIASYTVNTWIDASQVYVTASRKLLFPCSSPKADIVFVVDSSSSIGRRNFNTMKDFLRNVVDSFVVSENKVRVGLIQFSNSSRIHFSLQQYSDEDDVKDAISKMPYIEWSTNSAAGLKTTSRMIQRQGRHDDGIAVVVIFLTDGKSNNASETELAAENLHSVLPKVTVFAVGIGSTVERSELRTIASAPKCIRVFFLDAFAHIPSFASQILKGACKAQAGLDEGREIRGELEKGQRYYVRITAKKDKNGVRIRIKASDGAVKAFFSWLLQNPSEAFYDFTADVNVQSGSVDVYIGWNEEAEKRAVAGRRFRRATTGGQNQTTVQELPLYGVVVGVDSGQNTFTMSYVDSAIQHSARLLTLITAFVAFILVRAC